MGPGVCQIYLEVWFVTNIWVRSMCGLGFVALPCYVLALPLFCSDAMRSCFHAPFFKAVLLKVYSVVHLITVTCTAC